MVNRVAAWDDSHPMTPSPAPTARHHPAADHDSVKTLPPQDVFAPTADDVARRAYLYFQNHGIANGRDVQDWLQAEAELKAEWQLVGN